MALWFQIVYAALLFGATTYYLLRSWKRRKVTVGLSVTLARRGFNGNASRDSEPGLYWFGMSCFLLFDLLFLGLLLKRTYELLIQPRYPAECRGRRIRALFAFRQSGVRRL